MPPARPTIPLKLEAAICAAIALVCVISLLSNNRGESSWAGSSSPSPNASGEDLLRRTRSQPRELLAQELAAQITYADELQALYEKEEATRNKLTEERSKYEEDLGRAQKEKSAEVQRRDEMEREKGKVERDRIHLVKELEASMYLDTVVMRKYLEENQAQLEADWRGYLSRLRPQGIVMSAGGAGPLTNAFVTLHVLRHHHKCTLPAVIMYWGAYGGDNIDGATKKVFKDHIPDLEFIDASKVPAPQYQRYISPLKADGAFVRQSGFKIKAYTLYAAPFREVLFLDSDSLPLLDPACLFKEENYLKRGNLYWADYYDRDVGPFMVKRIFEVLRVVNPWANDSRERQTEAGQFVFNRAMHWDVLEWLHFLTARSELVYRLSYGDKDTYRMAFHLAGKASTYHLVNHHPAMFIKDKLLTGMLQLHPNGTVMFHHRTRSKYKLEQKGPLERPDYVTPSLPGDLGTHVANKGPWKGQIITPATCSYSFWDLPAAQHRCVPNFDEAKRGLDQNIPLFEYTRDNHIARAEAAGYKAFKVVQGAIKKP